MKKVIASFLFLQLMSSISSAQAAGSESLKTIANGLRACTNVVKVEHAGSEFRIYRNDAVAQEFDLDEMTASPFSGGVNFSLKCDEDNFGCVNNFVARGGRWNDLKSSNGLILTCPGVNKPLTALVDIYHEEVAESDESEETSETNKGAEKDESNEDDNAFSKAEILDTIARGFRTCSNILDTRVVVSESKLLLQVAYDQVTSFILESVKLVTPKNQSTDAVELRCKGLGCIQTFVIMNGRAHLAQTKDSIKLYCSGDRNILSSDSDGTESPASKLNTAIKYYKDNFEN